MFTEFSRGYYIGELTLIQGGEDGCIVMCQAQFDTMLRQLYRDDGGPIVMRVGTHHFQVHGNEDVPEYTLSCPSGFLEKVEIKSTPIEHEVFLAKPEYVDQLIDYTTDVREHSDDESIPQQAKGSAGPNNGPTGPTGPLGPNS